MDTITFLGPEGTFAHAALLSIPVAAQARLVPAATVAAAMRAVRDGEADAALVPLENSIEGGVPATLDELARGTPLVIAAETFLAVAFDLLVRPGTALAEVRTVATHPHAEAQVRGWLGAELPEARVHLVESTAGAAAAVAAGTYDASVSASAAGPLHGLVPLVRDIADHAGAVTRFVLLTRPAAPPPPTGNDRTTLVAYLRADHAGALLEILTEFATRGVNLTRIESRPTTDRLGDYCFSIDCEGHVAEQRVGDALAALHRVCGEIRYLGSYPRREGTQGPIVPGRSDAEFAASRSWLDAVRRDGNP